jgi:hypothetical protein
VICPICSPLRPQLPGQMGKFCDQGSNTMRALGGAHAKMNTMQYYNTSFVRIASANLLGILTALSLNGTVLAAGKCIEGPKAGGRWDYRVDPVNHRKCWYVTDTGLKTHEGAPLQPTPSPTSTPNSTFAFLVRFAEHGPSRVRFAGHATKHHTRIRCPTDRSWPGLANCSHGPEEAGASSPSLRIKRRNHRGKKSTTSVSLVSRTCGPDQHAAA